MNFRACFLIASTLVLVGCKVGESHYVPEPPPALQKVSIAPGKEGDLFPLVTNSQWIYKLTDQLYKNERLQSETTKTYTFALTDVKETPDGTKATMTLTPEDGAPSYQIWLSNDKGLFELSQGPTLDRLVEFKPPQPVFYKPIDTSKSSDWTGTGITPNGAMGKMTAMIRSLASQTVDTDLGQFSSIPVETTVAFTSTRKGVSKNTAFFSLGVGLVRYRQETAIGADRLVSTLVLSKYSVKNP